MNTFYADVLFKQFFACVTPEHILIVLMLLNVVADRQIKDKHHYQNYKTKTKLHRPYNIQIRYIVGEGDVEGKHIQKTSQNTNIGNVKYVSSLSEFHNTAQKCELM